MGLQAPFHRCERTGPSPNNIQLVKLGVKQGLEAANAHTLNPDPTAPPAPPVWLSSGLERNGRFPADQIPPSMGQPKRNKLARGLS